MTDLQIKYQTLLETERANKAQEALGAVRNQASLISAEASKQQADVAESRLEAELPKILEEIKKIKSETGLNSARTIGELSDTTNTWIKNLNTFMYKYSLEGRFEKVLGWITQILGALGGGGGVAAIAKLL